MLISVLNIQLGLQLHNTRAAWLGFAIGSKTGMRSVRLKHHAKQVQ